MTRGDVADDRRRRALAGSALTFAVVAPATYLVMRVIERTRAPVVNPGLILASTHMDFVWRSAVSAWFAGSCSTIAYLRTRDEGPSRRRIAGLSLGVLLVGVALMGVALRYP